LDEPIFSPGAPVEASAKLFWLGVGFFILFLAAIGLELLRRWRRRRLEVKAQWRLVEGICRENLLEDEEARCLRKLIERWAPEAPLRVATDRRRFDHCVEQEMNASSAEGSAEQFKEAGALLRRVRERLETVWGPRHYGVDTTRNLPAGQVVWVSPTGSDTPRWYAATIEEVDEAYLHLSPSKGKEARPPRFGPGEELRCRLNRPNDAQYAFTTVLAACEDHPPRWLLFHATRLERSQSRAYFRVPYKEAAALAMLGPADGPEGGPSVVKPLPGVFHDLSAGGFAAVVREAPGERALLAAQFDFGGQEPLVVRATIVEVRPLSSGHYLVRAEFVDMEEDARDAIARYVLHRQQPMVAFPGEPVREGAE